jgi:HK97 gp10 family phage protein
LLNKLKKKEQTKALMKGGDVFERGAKSRIRKRGLIDTGNLRASTTAEPDPRARHARVLVGPKTVYAAIHEFGGTVQPSVTPRMRGWAWAMYRETGEGVYRGIALTRKKKLNINIPARPYMRPTFDQDKKAAIKAIRKALTKMIDRLF